MTSSYSFYYSKIITEQLKDAKVQAKQRKLSRYGGWIDGPKQKGTGRFRTEKVGDKWWLIDPEGYLFFSVGACLTGHRAETSAEPKRENGNFFSYLPDSKDYLRWTGLRKVGGKQFVNFPAMNYQRYFGDVVFNFGANATYVLEYKFDAFEFNGLQFDNGYEASGWANYGRDPGTVSKWRGNAFASLGFEPVTLTYNVNYISGVDDNRCYNRDTGALIDPCAVTEFGGTNFGRRIGSFMQHVLLA